MVTNTARRPKAIVLSFIASRLAVSPLAAGIELALLIIA
jgi:hypothetical protein